LPEPELGTLRDDLSDIIGVTKENLYADADIIREMPEFLRKNKFSGTVVSCPSEVIAIEKEDTISANFAISIDLGTTTIVVTLIDLNKGHSLYSIGALNPQTRFGDDVLNRILAQGKSPKHLSEIRDCAVKAVNGLIRQLCKKVGIGTDKIYAASIAGNTVMEALFCGIPASALGVIPFSPPFKKGLLFPADETRLEIHPQARVWIFPVIGGFVGGDIVAGIISSGILKMPGKILFIDIGTNGEIVISNDGQLFAGSAAAGPAFEGARIESGMRAAPGAIEKFVIEEGRLRYNVIGNKTPRGICGTALIDSVAELLRIGVIDSTGRIVSPEECPPGTPDKIREHIIPDTEGSHCDFLLVKGEKLPEIFLRQKDVRELQLASGAIRAAINVIMKKTGTRAEELDLIMIAGTFGNYIRRKNAKRIGLVPPLPDDKIRYIGNSSAAGASAVMLSREKMKEAEDSARRTNYIEISQDPDFQTEFAEAMIFPET
jgi:uncharacterized 2Fe-2S/4Fe-4S cluster protein (DUF4445 family)